MMKILSVCNVIFIKYSSYHSSSGSFLQSKNINVANWNMQNNKERFCRHYFFFS